MMNYLPKKKRGVYEKEFTLQHVIQNFQGYLIASGKIDSDKIRERARKGEDLGEIYANLLASKSNSGETLPAGESTDTKKRKRKRRRRKLRTTPSQAVEVVGSSSSRDAATRVKSAFPQLVSYGDSSSSSEVSDEDGDTSSATQKTTGPLPIPAAIRDLYEDECLTEYAEQHQSTEETKMSARAATMDSDSDSLLGYFEPVDSTSVDEEEEEEGARKMNSCLQTESFPGTNTSGRDLIPVVTRKWSDDKAQWLFGPSQLSSYTCWKCNNVGHLGRDCTVAGSHSLSSPSSSETKPGKTRPKIPHEVQALLATCREVRLKKGQRCADCGIHTNLAACLDCGSTFCDGRGHLLVHLQDHPSHNKLFSFKLKRLVKCCKSTCAVVSIYDLLVCSHCLGKAFSQHYSMVTAIWSRAGLIKACNAIGCDEHFQWHRMNCEAVGDEKFVSLASLQSRMTSGTLSEFFF